MSEWVTTIISGISSVFTSLYAVLPGESGSSPSLASNPILACVLIPVVSGIAAFCVRLAKRRKG